MIKNKITKNWVVTNSNYKQRCFVRFIIRAKGTNMTYQWTLETLIIILILSKIPCNHVTI